MTQDSHGSGGSVASASKAARVAGRRDRVTRPSSGRAAAIALAAGPNSGSSRPPLGGKSAATLDVSRRSR